MGSNGGSNNAEWIIMVTSCNSDACRDQKTLGTTPRLPRRASSALKTFDELAVGIKDAYEAGGCMPIKPRLEDGSM